MAAPSTSPASVWGGDGAVSAETAMWRGRCEALEHALTAGKASVLTLQAEVELLRMRARGQATAGQDASGPPDAGAGLEGNEHFSLRKQLLKAEREVAAGKAARAGLEEEVRRWRSQHGAMVAKLDAMSDVMTETRLVRFPLQVWRTLFAYLPPASQLELRTASRAMYIRQLAVAAAASAAPKWRRGSRASDAFSLGELEALSNNHIPTSAGGASGSFASTQGAPHLHHHPSVSGGRGGWNASPADASHPHLSHAASISGGGASTSSPSPLMATAHARMGGGSMHDGASVGGPDGDGPGDASRTHRRSLPGSGAPGPSASPPGTNTGGGGLFSLFRTSTRRVDAAPPATVASGGTPPRPPTASTPMGAASPAAAGVGPPGAGAPGGVAPGPPPAGPGAPPAGLASLFTTGDRGKPTVDYKQLATLLHRVKAADGMITRLRMEVADLTEKVRTSEGVQKFFKEQNDRLEGEMRKMEVERDTARSQQAIHEETLQHLDEQMQQTGAELKITKRRCEEAELKADALMKAVEEQATLIADLRRQLQGSCVAVGGNHARGGGSGSVGAEDGFSTPSSSVADGGGASPSLAPAGDGLTSIACMHADPPIPLPPPPSGAPFAAPSPPSCDQAGGGVMAAEEVVTRLRAQVASLEAALAGAHEKLAAVGVDVSTGRRASCTTAPAPSVLEALGHGRTSSMDGVRRASSSAMNEGGGGTDATAALSTMTPSELMDQVLALQREQALWQVQRRALASEFKKVAAERDSLLSASMGGGGGGMKAPGTARALSTDVDGAQ